MDLTLLTVDFLSKELFLFFFFCMICHSTTSWSWCSHASVSWFRLVSWCGPLVHLQPVRGQGTGTGRDVLSVPGCHRCRLLKGADLRDACWRCSRRPTPVRRRFSLTQSLREAVDLVLERCWIELVYLSLANPFSIVPGCWNWNVQGLLHVDWRDDESEGVCY